MELIDRGALLEQVDDLAVSDCEVFRAEALRLIADAPTIDAVQVVRCRDCRWAAEIPSHAATAFIPERVRDCTNQRGDWKPVFRFSAVDADGYCDEGERMDADAPPRATDHFVDANKKEADAPERAERNK